MRVSLVLVPVISWPIVSCKLVWSKFDNTNNGLMIYLQESGNGTDATQDVEDAIQVERDKKLIKKSVSQLLLRWLQQTYQPNIFT